MNDKHHFVSVEFHRFKAHKKFTLEIKPFNILVGPNNAGKSTILTAFRILSAAMRTANAKRATQVRGQHGMTFGYSVDLSAISVAEENIFYDYDESEPAYVKFTLSNKNSLTLLFPEQGACLLIPESQGGHYYTPASFSKNFNCNVGFVPILGPVEHNEPLYEKNAARLALVSYRAARNFRNIWHHYPEKFEQFRTMLCQTWPGMDIEPPEIDRTHAKPRLYMYCPERRKPRELFWSGFGFQVWCQMLTHIIQSSESSIFLIDEPDIYLHSELQRQLLGLLRSLGPDILLATHSTEIVTEAETDEIILIGKDRKSGRRIKDPAQVGAVFNLLGSSINPILTQLAKTRRVLFVEGADFRILGKFARKLGYNEVAIRKDFAVVQIEGFNPERMRNLKEGMEKTLGSNILSAAILDRDYRSISECESIRERSEKFCEFVAILEKKEIENFLLVPDALDRALAIKLADRAKRQGTTSVNVALSKEVLVGFAESKRTYVSAQMLSSRKAFERSGSSGMHEAEINQIMLDYVNGRWVDIDSRLGLLPGKEAFSFLNNAAQNGYSTSITPSAVIDAMRNDEIPSEMRSLIGQLNDFCSRKIDD